MGNPTLFFRNMQRYFLVGRTRLCGKSSIDVLLEQIFDDDDDELPLFPVIEDSGFRFVGIIFFLIISYHKMI